MEMPNSANGAIKADEITVNELIRHVPATVQVFNDFGIDACCGGAVPVREAAERDGADVAALLEALAAVAGGAA
jgi:iron-sulfur cluster repair protein YtfE (RIC family)